MAHTLVAGRPHQAGDPRRRRWGRTGSPVISRDHTVTRCRERSRSQASQTRQADLARGDIRRSEVHNVRDGCDGAAVPDALTACRQRWQTLEAQGLRTLWRAVVGGILGADSSERTRIERSNLIPTGLFRRWRAD